MSKKLLELWLVGLPALILLSDQIELPVWYLQIWFIPSTIYVYKNVCLTDKLCTGDLRTACSLFLHQLAESNDFIVTVHDRKFHDRKTVFLFLGQTNVYGVISAVCYISIISEKSQITEFKWYDSVIYYHLCHLWFYWYFWCTKTWAETGIFIMF